MDRPTVRVRHGAHRAGRGIAEALVPSLLAVAAVAALITSLAVWQAEQPTRPEPVAAAARDASSTPAPGATTARPTGRTSSAPAPATTSPSSAAPTTEAPEAADFDVEVVVLNQTSRTGLAGTVADELRSRGWTVPAVGNFRGVVPATTVYYPDGQQAAAEAVAADLPTEPRVRPRFGNLSRTRLTVVVTDSYPG